MIKKILKAIVIVPVLVIYTVLLVLSTILSVAVFAYKTRVINGKKILFLHSKYSKMAASVYEGDEIKRLALKSAQLAGGSAVKVSTLINFSKPLINKAAAPFVLWPYAILGLEYQVNIYKESTEGLTKKEIEAVYQHELGHIFNGDLEQASVQQGLPIELAADRYAAERTSASHMASALRKIIGNARTRLSEDGEMVTPEAEEEINKRLEALQV